MIEDNEIKTKVSPFAMREGEIKVFDGKDGYVSMNQILELINIGQISEIHFRIMELISKYECMTSRQILQILQMENFNINTDRLNRRLDNLVRNKIITKYYFTTGSKTGAYRVYCLEKMGKYLLNSREIECRWQPTDNVKPVALMKKRLAANQVLIACMRKAKNFSKEEIKPQLRAKMKRKFFKPAMKIEFVYNNQKIDFVYEVVRREENWEEKFIERAKLFDDFYKNFVPGDSSFIMPPQLVFVCEDAKHMVETFKILTNNKLLETVKAYYTTDIVHNQENLEKSLCTFIAGKDGLYTVKNIETPVLA